jgi:hypothetical protein
MRAPFVFLETTAETCTQKENALGNPRAVVSNVRPPVHGALNGYFFFLAGAFFAAFLAAFLVAFFIV